MQGSFYLGVFASIVQKGYIIILYILYFSLEFGALEMSFQELNGTFLNNCSARSSVQITVRKYKLSKSKNMNKNGSEGSSPRNLEDEIPKFLI